MPYEINADIDLTVKSKPVITNNNFITIGGVSCVKATFDLSECPKEHFAMVLRIIQRSGFNIL